MESPNLAALPIDLDQRMALVAPMFDAALYLLHNTDVKKVGIDPLVHYLEYGWHERRDPASNFSTRGYLAAYPELVQANIPPLVNAAALAAQPVDHRLKALFIQEYYLSNHHALRDTGVDPLRHYLIKGWKEGNDPSPYISTRHYLSQVPELADGPVSPLEHYVKAGMPPEITLLPCSGAAEPGWNGFWNAGLLSILQAQGYTTEGFSNHPVLYGSEIIMAMFSPDDYRRRHPDLANETDLALLTRYLQLDLPRGVSPGPLFDTEHYRRRLAAARMVPPQGPEFLDWLQRGRIAGLSPNPAFEERNYALSNPNLAATLEHWLLYGLREQRQFMPNITLGALPMQNGKPPRHLLGRVFAEGTANRAWKELEAMQTFRNGGLKQAIIAAQAIEPMIGMISERTPSYLPPWHDNLYLLFKACVERLPQGSFDSVVAIPFCKMGGADFVAGVLSRALMAGGSRVLVLRTEQPDWERPDWFPEDVATADLSDLLDQVDMRARSQVLYTLLHHVEARRLFNVNSRAAYETMLRFGNQMRQFMELYTYYFCADRRPDGTEVGYAIDFFSQLQGNLDCALIDNADFAKVLIERHSLSPDMALRVRPIYSPAMEPSQGPAVVEAQITSASQRQRPSILWAGRFDRQKRFDLVQEIARLMPDVDFLCWGKAVLEQAPDMAALPPNMRLMGTYTSLDELPLQDCDGWLYTSGWDGLPTILIEIAARGMPVVASAVGGVPELIDETTGWPVSPESTARDYADMLQKMLATPQQRETRAQALMVRARTRHSFDHYCAALKTILASSEDLPQ